MSWPLIVVVCPKATPDMTWPVRPRAKATGKATTACPSCGRQLHVQTPGGRIALVGPAGGHALAGTKVTV